MGAENGRKGEIKQNVKREKTSNGLSSLVADPLFGFYEPRSQIAIVQSSQKLAQKNDEKVECIGREKRRMKWRRAEMRWNLNLGVFILITKLPLCP